MPPSRKAERIRPLARALLRASDADRRLRSAAADRLGVGVSDLDALLLIDASGPLTAGRIAEAMALTTGAVTGLVDRLERAGWVQRARHEADRRQVLIELAPERRGSIDAHWAERERLVAEAVGEASEAALAEHARLLDAVADHLSASRSAQRQAEEAAVAEESGEGDRAPIGAAERGTLRFSSGAAKLKLRGARIKDLYRASFEGKRPRISADADGAVAVQYKGLSWFGARDIGAELTLTTAVPWAIEVKRGVSQLTADLHDLHLSSFEISGGVSESVLSLPRPRGTGVVRISGGASKLTIKRPRGAAAQVVIRGGASNFVFDAQRLGAVGSTTRLGTPGWESAADRWSVELTGGASELSVVEE